MFHVFDRVIWRKKKMPDGSTAEINYLFLGDKYLENFNTFYLKPFNYGLFKSLKTNIAKRLYEILDVKFYGLKGAYWSIVYEDLCDLLPIKVQKYFSLACIILKPPHEELKRINFLKEVKFINPEKHPNHYPLLSRTFSQAKERDSGSQRPC